MSRTPTDTSDAALDALVHGLQKQCPYPVAGNSVVLELMGDAADVITALRAKVAIVTDERDDAISSAIYNAEYVDLVTEYAAKAKAAYARGVHDAADVIGQDWFPIEGLYDDESPQQKACLNAMAAAQNKIRALAAAKEKMK